MEYASRGVANTALGLSIGALGVEALSGGFGGLLGNLGGRNAAATDTAAMLGPVMGALAGAAVNGGNGSRSGCSENTPVTRYELELQQTIAAKDSEIADLKSSQYTDQKLVEVYTALDRRDIELRNMIQKNKDEQSAVNLNQAVYNGTNTAAVACLQGQVAQLQGLTKLVVPNSSCCPGWGEVKVTPVTTTTTTTA